MRTLLLLPLLAACDGAKQTDSAAAAPTWSADVAPLVTERCGACHTDGGASFALDSYDDAAPYARAMASAIEAGAMPPWDAASTDECQPRFGFKNDPTLSDEEKALIRAWADAGAPEGDPATAAPLPEPPELTLTDATDVVGPTESYVTSGDDDEFICFVIDPALAEDSWLTGLQVEPGNAEVVHHVLVFSDPNQSSLDLADEHGRYDCFGSSGIGDAALLGAWAPGAFPNKTPDDAGIPVTAGSLLVMQVHYHPHGAVADPDLTQLHLRWTTEQPANEAVLALVGNASSKREGLLSGPNDSDPDRPEFVIPAGATGHTETIEYTLDAGDGPYTIFSAGTHMHYIGTDMLIEVDHAEPVGDEPATECLIQTPTWDFNWQRGYAYDAPLDQVPVLRGGDTLRLRCTYDNTLDNPGVQAALADAGLSEPIEVRLGEETLDEMCLGVFGIVY